MMDFIYPANIDIGLFRKKWAKYEWENRKIIKNAKSQLERNTITRNILHLSKSIRQN